MADHFRGEGAAFGWEDRKSGGPKRTLGRLWSDGDGALAFSDQFGDRIAKVEPVGVRIKLGELAGVIGNVDIGSHTSSMHRFEKTCKSCKHVSCVVFCTLNKLNSHSAPS